MASKFKWDDRKLVAATRKAAQKTMFNLAEEYCNEVRHLIRKPYPPASEPGEPPRQRTGNLYESIGHESRKGDIDRRAGPSGEIGPIARWLELGTARMPARPYLRPALFRIAQKSKRIMVKVAVPIEGNDRASR